MENRLEYYRPRGAQGNYKATLKLEYISSETVEVICYIVGKEAPNLPAYGQGYVQPSPNQEITVDAVVEGNVVTYALPPLKVGDYVFIRIQDKDIALPQINLYRVEEKRIQSFMPLSVGRFYTAADDWYPLTDFERQHWEAIRKTQFKPIELIDMDGKQKKWLKLF